MLSFEKRFFQSHLHAQNQRLTEMGALNPCYGWLSNGGCINQKTLNYEIETIFPRTGGTRRYRHV